MSTVLGHRWTPFDHCSRPQVELERAVERVRHPEQGVEPRCAASAFEPRHADCVVPVSSASSRWESDRRTRSCAIRSPKARYTSPNSSGARKRGIACMLSSHACYGKSRERSDQAARISSSSGKRPRCCFENMSSPSASTSNWLLSPRRSWRECRWRSARPRDSRPGGRSRLRRGSSGSRRPRSDLTPANAGQSQICGR